MLEVWGVPSAGSRGRAPRQGSEGEEAESCLLYK